MRVPVRRHLATAVICGTMGLALASGCASDPAFDGPTDVVDADADATASDVGGDAAADASADAVGDTGVDAGDGVPDVADAGTDPEADGFADVLDVLDVANECDGVAGPVVINEVQVRGDEWIELLNLGDCPAVLDGWELTDDMLEPRNGLVLEASHVVPALDFLVIDSDEVTEGGFPFGLTSEGESVRLLDAEGTVADLFVYGPVPEGASMGRLPDGTGLVQRTAPTRAAANTPWPDPTDEAFAEIRLLTLDLSLDEFDIASLGVQPRVDVVVGLTVTDPEGAVLLQHDVAAHIKGRYGSARSLDQKAAFKIDLNDVVVDGQLFGMTKLTVNNMVQDASCIHEWTAYDIFRGIGVPAPRVNYAWVRVNGVDYGLYAIVETPDDTVLDRYFATTQHLYEGAYGTDLFAAALPDFDVDEGDEVVRTDLENLIRIAETTPLEAQWDAFRPWLHEAVVVRAMAAEVFIGHWDGYAPTRNNYFLHFDAAGRLTLMPWGTDQTFDAGLGLYEGSGILFQACMADVGCRTEYHVALGEIVDYIADSGLVDRLPALGSFVRPLFEGDPRREWGMDAHDWYFLRTIAFLTERSEAVRAVIDCELDPGLDRDDDGFTCAVDCNDLDAGSNPDAAEVCGDGIDQNCTGGADEPEFCPDCYPVGEDDAFVVCPFRRNYFDAGVVCAERGARLPVIRSAEDNRLLAAVAATYLGTETWIGLDDLAVEGEFAWVDGSPLTFSAWAPGEPNDWASNEDCAHFYGNAEEWNDITCDVQMATLCVRVEE